MRNNAQKFVVEQFSPVNIKQKLIVNKKNTQSITGLGGVTRDQLPYLSNNK
jgi:hypothetical protein